MRRQRLAAGLPLVERRRPRQQRQRILVLGSRLAEALRLEKRVALRFERAAPCEGGDALLFARVVDAQQRGQPRERLGARRLRGRVGEALRTDQLDNLGAGPPHGAVVFAERAAAVHPRKEERQRTSESQFLAHARLCSDAADDMHDLGSGM